MWDFKKLHEKLHEKMDEMQRLGGLRIWIIHVLDEGPKNGVEIMDAIEEHHLMIQKRHMNDDRFNRRMINAMKRPSPGSVYPMLKKMVEEKLITKLEDGKYELTDKGQEIASKFFGRFRPKENNMDRCGLIVEDALSEIESYVSFLEDIKPGKLTPHIEKIDAISERIEKIRRSLNKD
jgi:DNA-binding PadR family transcriptional regulator